MLLTTAGPGRYNSWLAVRGTRKLGVRQVGRDGRRAEGRDGPLKQGGSVREGSEDDGGPECRHHLSDAEESSRENPSEKRRCHSGLYSAKTGLGRAIMRANGIRLADGRNVL